MMKRFLFQLFICSIIVVFNILKDMYPVGIIYLKHSICDLKIDQYVDSNYDNELLSFLDDTEKQELKNLKQFQDEFCNK